MKNVPVRRLGALTATLLVVANMVGTGVFTTTGFLVADISSPIAVLIAWLLGGTLALCGALAYGELAAALPRNGGEYQLLSRIYHPAVGFVAGFLSLIVGFAAPIAAASLAFGVYLGAYTNGVLPVMAAVTLIASVTVLHAAHVTVGGGVQNVFVLGKVLLILVFIGLGAREGDIAWLSGGDIAADLLSPAFAVGLVFISFAYSGWNGAAYLAGEVKRPARTLPLALFAGTAIVTLLYLGLNAVFLASGPVAGLAGEVDVGRVAAVRLFGASAGGLLSGLIALALVSSVSAMTMAGPRVYEAMGVDHPRLHVLAWRGKRGGPVVALALQGLIALVLILTASFETLLMYIGFTLSVSTGLTVAGVFVLRWREPDLPRPYRTWGYPVTPLLFIGLSLWMIVHTLRERPTAALAGLATLAAGLALYGLVGRPAGPSGDAKP